MKTIKNKWLISYCLAMVISLLLAININADEIITTYSIVYGENTATVTLYVTEIDSFDLGIVYDPSVVKVKDCGYTTEFKELQRVGTNMTLSVLNEDAKDDNGNTYMVFTGAGTNRSTGGAIDFKGKPLATVTFEGDINNARITIVSDTAAVENIYSADIIAELLLNNSEEISITPEPIEGVSYITPAPEATEEPDSGTGTENNNTITDAPDNVSDNNSESNETEVPIVTEETSMEETKAPVAEENALSSDKDENLKGNDVNAILICVIVAVVLVVTTVIIVIVIKKKKK